MQESNKLSGRNIIISIITFAILYMIDRVSKTYVASKLKDSDPITFFNDKFELSYLENVGAAWGILSGKQLFLIVFTMLIICIIIFFYFRIPGDKRFLILKISVILLLTGAIGNLVDRIRFNYVIDFLYFKAIDFPVFNIADCYVTVGAFILVLCLMFKYDQDELDFWFLSKKPEE